MINYTHKCNCGQPYDVHIEKYFPEKDEFTHPCPSCGSILKHRLRALDEKWIFDPNFKKQ